MLDSQSGTAKNSTPGERLPATLGGWSLKSKLLGLLIALPSLALSIYFFFAVNVFETDKIAYVFDSTSSVSKTVSSQTASDIKMTAGSFTELLGISTAADRAEKTRQFLAKSKDTDSIVFYSSKNGAPLEIDSAYDAADPIPAKDMPFALANAEAACISSPSFFPATNEQNSSDPYFFFSICNKTDSGMIALSAYTSNRQIAGPYLKNGVSANYLIDRNGRQLFGPTRAQKENFANWNFFERMKVENLSSGTFETKAPDGRSLLVSFSKTGVSNLVTLSMIDKNVALNAAKTLFEKSILFLFSVISISIIISVFASNKLTQALRSLSDAAQTVAEGNFDVKIDVKTKDEVGNLAMNFNHMAREVSRLMSDNIEKTRMEKELETARTVQETLFPEAYFNFGNLEVSGFYQPASECGGDWWYYCDLGEKVMVWIGDATGHGVPAALMTSAARSAAAIIEMQKNIAVDEAMKLLNSAIYSTSKGSLQMTFFIGCFDKKSGLFTYANASHNPPFFVANTDEPLSKKDFIPMNEVNSKRLGENPLITVEIASQQLKPGDTVLFYTDGVTELVDNAGKEWSIRNLTKSFISAWNKDRHPNSMVSAIKRDVESFRAGAPLKDDVTFFVCRYKGSDPDQITRATTQSETQILIPNELMKAAEVISMSREKHIQHIIQCGDAELSAHENNVAQIMIKDSATFMTNPLQHILTGEPSNVFEFKVGSLQAKMKMLKELSTYLEGVHGAHNVANSIKRIADELSTNALFSAAVDKNGIHKYSQLPRNVDFNLETEENFHVHCAFDQKQIAISVEDPFGTLSIDRMIERIDSIYKYGHLKTIEKESDRSDRNKIGGGAGIGVHTAFDLSKSFYVAVENGRKTSITSVLPLGLKNRELEEMPKSLHLLNIKRNGA